MVVEDEKIDSEVREFTHPYFKLTLREDGVLIMTTADNAYFTIKEAKEYVVAMNQITNGIPRLVLKIPGNHASIDTETRKFMATHEALHFSIAEAVIVRSLAQRLIGNFYLKFDKPLVPVKLFDQIDSAEKWLKEFEVRNPKK